MRITRKGVSFERWEAFTLRPNVCSFVDEDGATLNINTITLIQMYKALEAILIKDYDTTIEQVIERHKT
jgi:hypothetical protein